MQQRALSTITEIVVHCSATRPEWMHNQTTEEKRAEIRRWHLARKFSDFGYHALIDRDGTVVQGRNINETGAHVKGHNLHTLGVCLVGGFGSSADDRFSENFTAEQDAALRKWIVDVNKIVGRQLMVTGHNQYANKACPGFNAPNWYRNPSMRDLRPNVVSDPVIKAVVKPLVAVKSSAVKPAVGVTPKIVPLKDYAPVAAKKVQPNRVGSFVRKLFGG